ncbi:MAG: hypothetical protein ACI9LN_003088 [Saprospiraceae bacterium]
MCPTSHYFFHLGAKNPAATFKNPKVVFLFLKTKCVNGLIVKELND